MKIDKDSQSERASDWSGMQPRREAVYLGQTRKGRSLRFWKPHPIARETERKQLDRGIDPRYACHGFTVGTHLHPNGPFTPFGDSIDKILVDEFTPIREAKLKPGDVVVWQDEDGLISHTARITYLKLSPVGRLLPSTRLASKNGAMVFRERFRLETLLSRYGNNLSFYRELPDELREIPTLGSPW